MLANIAYRVASGLSFLHSRRLLHRDVKPSNILINRAGDVKIGDFGIARMLDATGAGKLASTYQVTSRSRAYSKP